VQRALEKRKSTPALANNFKKALSALFAWAVDHGHVETNPTVGVKSFKGGKNSGFPVWTLADVEKFVERWEFGTRERLAFELIIASGLRRSDAVRAGRQNMVERVLQINTQKTKIPVTIELSPRLLELIDSTKTGDMTFIVGKRGQPMTKESFGNWFRAACRSAGVEKSAHGLRKFSATLAAEAGATSHQLMAQFGWITIKQAEAYTNAADRVHLGKATSRIIEEQIVSKVTPHHRESAGNSRNKRFKTVA
jgi:integrase